MPTRVSDKPTLAEAGIDKHLADRARKPATLPGRRKAIYEELHPETKHGGEREPSRQVGDLPASERFTANTAAATGRSEARYGASPTLSKMMRMGLSATVNSTGRPAAKSAGSSAVTGIEAPGARVAPVTIVPPQGNTTLKSARSRPS
jgi:hypothetical protein